MPNENIPIHTEESPADIQNNETNSETVVDDSEVIEEEAAADGSEVIEVNTESPYLLETFGGYTEIPIGIILVLILGLLLIQIIMGGRKI